MSKKADIIGDDIKARLQDLIQRQYRRYPMMQIEDVYKVIYQSIMGPAHLLHDEKKAFTSLWEELANSPGKEKDLFVDISLDRKLVRVNLNVFTQLSGSAKKLFSAIQKTSLAITPDKEKLQKIWEIVGELVRDGELKVGEYAKWLAVTEKVRRNSFPPIEHSSLYRRIYTPSYRVILYDLLEYIF